jgi:hypothetical protein
VKPALLPKLECTQPELYPIVMSNLDFSAVFSKESLFALSLFPYLGFLWFLTRSKQVPKLALVGFYMTLVFVGVTIPVGIYAQTVYGKALANVDLLHGGAEMFLTLANVLVVLGFRQAIKPTSVSNEM